MGSIALYDSLLEYAGLTYLNLPILRQYCIVIVYNKIYISTHYIFINLIEIVNLCYQNST